MDWTGLYCTDADVAREAPDDYPALVPHAGLLARGTDGVFDAANRWVLTSASNNFEDASVGASNVLSIDKPISGSTPGPDILEVSSVSGTSVTLKRLRLDAGVGFPPGPSNGASSVQFTVKTCYPLIQDKTRQVKQTLRIDQDTDLESVEDVRLITVYLTLITLYNAAWKSATDKSAGSLFKAKAEEYTKQAQAQMMILDRTYGLSPQGQRPAVGDLASNTDYFPPDPYQFGYRASLNDVSG